MALVPWRGGELERLRREMDRMFERFWGPAEIERVAWEPEIDVSETDTGFILRGELPGLNPQDIDISLMGHTLTLRGEKRQEREEKAETYRLVERIYGSFSRTIELPTDIDPEHIEATYKQGVLEVRLPKTEKAIPKKVPVTSG